MLFQHHPLRLLPALAFVLAGCSQDSPVQAIDHSHHADLALSSLSGPAAAPALAALTQLTAPFHDLDAAQAAGYGLFTLTPLTAADGCISSAKEGGMGYHYSRLNNLGDDAVSLLDPEFLVYAPKSGPRKDGEARRRLAAFDYFIPTARNGLDRMIRTSSARRRCTTSRRCAISPTSRSRRRDSAAGCFTSGCGSTTQAANSPIGIPPFRSAKAPRSEISPANPHHGRALSPI